MVQPACVGLCGDSIFMYGLETGLALLPNLSVTRFSPYEPELIEALERFKPDMLIIETDPPHTTLVSQCVERGWRILLVSAASTQTLFVQSQSIELSDFDALVRLVRPSD